MLELLRPRVDQSAPRDVLAQQLCRALLDHMREVNGTPYASLGEMPGGIAAVGALDAELAAWRRA